MVKPGGIRPMALGVLMASSHMLAIDSSGSEGSIHLKGTSLPQGVMPFHWSGPKLPKKPSPQPGKSPQGMFFMGWSSHLS